MAKLGSASEVEAYWNAAAPHLQARFCHNTLGTKIKIERIGCFKHYAGKTLTASTASLEAMWDDTEADLGSADLMVYICYDTSSYGGVMGKAYKYKVCLPPDENKWKHSINEWRYTSVGFGSVNKLYNQCPKFLHNTFMLMLFTERSP